MGHNSVLLGNAGLHSSDAGSSVVAVTDEEEDMDWGKRGKQL